jgi:hypothetical protein
MIKISIPYRGMEKCKVRMLDVIDQCQDADDVFIQIVEQSNDGRRFNLGKMINVGFDLCSNNSVNDDWVYMFHPVDLFPKQGILPYKQGMEFVLKNHVSVIRYNVIGQAHFYRACQYSPAAYRLFNGYTNEFWGWGAEDDEFFNRLRIKQIPSHYMNLEFNTWSETKQDHEPDHPSPDFLMGLSHHEQNVAIANSVTLEKLSSDGLSNLSYRVISEKTIGKNIRHIEVEL